jgi:hypothetical protein
MATTQRTLDEALQRLFASDAETVANPYPVFARLRAQSPVHRFGPIVLVSRYADCKSIILDPAGYSSQMQRRGTSRTEAARDAVPEDARSLFDDVLSIETRWMTQSDGEDHRRRRDIMRRAFTPRRIGLLGESAQRYTDATLEEMAERGGVSDLSVLAYRLPMFLACDLLDLPHSDADQLVEWGDTIMRNLFGGQGSEPLVAAHRSYTEIYEYVAEKIAGHRGSSHRSELLSALIEAERGQQLSSRELTAMFIELQVGSYETTRSLLATGLYELLRSPEQWQRLLDDPSLVRGAVDELMRIVSPAQWTARVALQAGEIEGVPVDVDETVILLLASANRDEEVFASPDELDVTRANARDHLGFSHGRHYCIGQALAVLESEVMFSTLLRRFPDLELASDAIEWTGNAINRRLAALPISLGRDRGAAAV